MSSTFYHLSQIVLEIMEALINPSLYYLPSKADGERNCPVMKLIIIIITITHIYSFYILFICIFIIYSCIYMCVYFCRIFIAFRVVYQLTTRCAWHS